MVEWVLNFIEVNKRGGESTKEKRMKGGYWKEGNLRKVEKCRRLRNEKLSKSTRGRKTEVSFTLNLNSKWECERTTSTLLIIVQFSVCNACYKSALFKVNYSFGSNEPYLTLHWCNGHYGAVLFVANAMSNDCFKRDQAVLWPMVQLSLIHYQGISFQGFALNEYIFLYILYLC